MGSENTKPCRTSSEPRLGSVFTGQGAQWYAMGRELVPIYPTFKEALQEAEFFFKELGATWSLLGMSLFSLLALGS